MLTGRKDFEEQIKQQIEALEKKQQEYEERLDEKQRQIEGLNAQLFRMNVELARVIKSQSKSIAKPPVIDLADYDIIKGNHNEIIKVIHRQTQKSFFFYSYLADPEALEKIFDRLISLYPLVISGVQEFYGYQYPLSESDKKKLNIYSSGSAGFILTDFLQFKSLKDYIINYHKGIDKDKFNSTRRTKIIFGIAAIMKKLHQHNIFIRNLNTSNILLDENLEPLMNYFDQQTVFPYSNYVEFVMGSALFFAPEKFDDDLIKKEFAVDVYSYAIIL